MVLKSAIAAVVCTGILLLSGSAMADEYRPSEFLALDLSAALLSPKRLGPESQFAPVAIEARTDRGGETAQVPQPVPETSVVAVSRIRVAKTRVAQTSAAKPVGKSHGAARVKLARRHGNPLDAQAADTRIQTWPCKSGGICEWQR